MLLPPLALLAIALGLGLAPGMGQRASDAAAGFANRPAYAAAVLGSTVPASGHAPEVAAPSSSVSSLLTDLGEAAGAVCLAGIALAGGPWAARLRRVAVTATSWLRRQHSGHVGDQVTWLVAGLALLAALSGLVLR